MIAMDNREIDAALTKARMDLASWHSAESFVKKVEDTGALLKSALLFGKPNVNFLLDAMVLAEFSKLRQIGQVRLPDVRDVWPDGFIGDPKSPTNVEITEVIEPGRKRGDEYRKAEQTGNVRGDDGPDDWRATAEKIPKALEDAIVKKIAKNYAVKPVLLIYLNMNEYGLLQEETTSAISEIKARNEKYFQEICVIWKERLF